MLYIIGLPLTTLIHEIGHAFGLVCSTKNGKARIYIGDFSDSNKENFKIGRIHFHIVWGVGGICKYEKDKMTKFQAVLTTIGGPLISALFTFILFFFFSFFINPLINFIL
ncbi:hypothetical protein [Lentibacillus daqui]|uniref:hypothetical protein n=1 Tax=Lentibacillus daqui TaxID=2911514 RepID=UPI0022B0B235|nr:hypothetical protein [Lentibacillus daqui]